ncbi:lytic transglycosylase domain-containing protein [uncultured Phenylobacterium sp.]|uniref:lytic transglycosylase domain-containing protein n=1 Tax=uncultured Phenylobacterium sp. TaxID=349273 RepID=UPI0025EC284D|nr:lytic transglycosylase domain-containing protein [uncultured Phenylobacterium sp.]
MGARRRDIFAATLPPARGLSKHPRRRPSFPRAPNRSTPPSTRPPPAAIAKLLHALVTVESAYSTNALSPEGAAGLTQLMPATAKDLGVTDRFNPSANLSPGPDYLARQILRFGDLSLALAATTPAPTAPPVWTGPELPRKPGLR